ncbi:MAG: RlpA-like double-psi beta-barrel domain-containing protein [Actinomycetota bacterium]|nr:RlpA-like double-psi beta-barrel domain-containing protein [Actinomycetota bacterium]
MAILSPPDARLPRKTFGLLWGKRSAYKHWAVLIGLVLVFSCLSFPTHSSAVTQKEVEKAKTEASRVDKRLAEIIEEYTEATDELAKLQRTIEQNQKLLKEAEMKLNRAVQNLNRRVVNLYKEKPTTLLTTLLHSQDLREFLLKLDFLIRIAQQDAKLVNSLKNSQKEVEKAITQMESARLKQEEVVDRLQRLKDQLQKELEAKQDKVAHLQRELERQRKAEEMARKLTARRISIPPPSGKTEEGWASWYGIAGYTAAHRTLPFKAKVRVTNLINGNQVEVTIVDRGPFTSSRIIDLSRESFSQLAPLSRGYATCA